LFGPVRITADEIVDSTSQGKSHIVCLSGGVDSTYAYLRNAHERIDLKREVSLGVFVQGFDYGLSDDDGFEAVLRKIRGVVSHDLPISRVRTNWRTLVEEDVLWDSFHTVGLAAIQHLFSGGCASGILASDYTFREDHIVAPWGSSAITNRLLSSKGFTIALVGEDVTRIDKIQAISDWGHLSNLSVCWQGSRTGDNCGHCEKCLRTMFMCEALRIDPTPAFARRPNAKEIRKLRLHAPGKRAFMRQALARFENPGREDLAKAAKRTVLRSEMRCVAKIIYDWLPVRIESLERKRAEHKSKEPIT